MKTRILVPALLAALGSGCASDMIRQQANDMCAAQGKSAFVTEVRHGGASPVVGNATATVMCFGAKDVTAMPTSFGASVVAAENLQGAGIVTVVMKSVADKAGLKIYDVIVAIDERPILRAAELRSALENRSAGDQSVLKIRRGREDLTLTARF